MELKREDKLRKITHYFGFRNQLKKLCEEAIEVMEAGIDIDYNSPFIDIMYEIADLTILLEQIRLYAGITKEELDKAIEKKIDRTLERIESGYYKGEIK